MGLDEAVGVFAGRRFDEVEEELAGEDEAAGGFEVLQHAVGVDEQFFDEVRGLGEEIVGEDGGVGKDDALGGGVRDVALVPEGTFSNATCALARTTRARPQICSLVMGLRLCGIADEPFCFSLKNSSASRTSVRWRWRISVAILSSVPAMTASVER